MDLGLGTCDTICVKVFSEVGDHICLDVEGSRGDTILDGLDSQGNLPKDPHLVSAKEKLLTFKIRHLETQTAHQVVVNE